MIDIEFQSSLPRGSAQRYKLDEPQRWISILASARKRHHFILTFTKTFYSHHPNSCTSPYFPFVFPLAIPSLRGANPPGQPCSLPFRTAPLRFASVFLSGACAAKNSSLAVNQRVFQAGNSGFVDGHARHSVLARLDLH